MDRPRLARLFAASVLVVLGSGCSSGDPVILESPLPTGISGPATISPDPSTSPIPAESAGAGLIDLADGRHPAFITDLVVADRKVTVDVIQILTGQEATDAYLRDHPEEAGGPPNDVYIVNANKKLRTGTIVDPVTVRLVKLAEDSDADLDDATLEELDAYLNQIDRLITPFWLTVAGGRITGLEEQYLP